MKGQEGLFGVKMGQVPTRSLAVRHTYVKKESIAEKPRLDMDKRRSLPERIIATIRTNTVYV